MEKLARFGISIPEELLKAFDEYIERKHYANRSEAIRDLIRQKLVEEEWKESKEEVIGVITYLYDHHKRELTDKLIEIQHDHYNKIITTQHIHVDHERCLEAILVRGKANEIKDLADKFSTKRSSSS
jgi:transcriptional regulator, CopG family